MNCEFRGIKEGNDSDLISGTSFIVSAGVGVGVGSVEIAVRMYGQRNARRILSGTGFLSARNP
jgi:hypothetical protein